MNYGRSDFENDYSEEEDYDGREGEDAFMYTLLDALDGDTHNMRVLGDIYSDCGHGVKTDYDKALFWYEKAAENGDRYSQWRMGDMLSLRMEKRDIPRALYWYEKAAAQGVAYAAGRAGTLLLSGKETDVGEKERAEKLIAFAAGEGDRASQYLLYRLKKERGEEKRELLVKAADGGHGKAAFELAFRLMEEGCADGGRIIYYLIKAANDVYDIGRDEKLKAQLTLAECYLNGKYVKPNAELAKYYFALAAEGGSEQAAAALREKF